MTPRPSSAGVAAAMAISAAGSVLNLLATIPLVYGRAHTAAVPVAVTVLVSFLPAVVVLPLISARLETASLRRTGIGLTVAQATVAGLMAAAAAAGAPIAVFWIAVAALGVMAHLVRVAVFSLIPRTVGLDRRRAATVLVQTAVQAGALVGALPLVVTHRPPVEVLYLLDAATFLVQAAMLAHFVADDRGALNADGRASIKVDRCVASRWTMILLTVYTPAGFVALSAVNIVAPLRTLAPGGGGQRAFAATEIMYPIAAIIVGLALRRGMQSQLGVGLAGIAIGFGIMAAWPGPAATLCAMLLCGAGVIAANSASQLWAQRTVPEAILPVVQARAVGVGSAIAACVVLGVALGYQWAVPTPTLAILTACFALAAGFAEPAQARPWSKPEMSPAASR